MKTTTVRFDHGSWAEIERYCEALGIAHAAFIRDAVIERLVRLDHADRLARVEQRVDDLSQQTCVVARTLTTIAARIGLTDGRPTGDDSSLHAQSRSRDLSRLT